MFICFYSEILGNHVLNAVSAEQLSQYKCVFGGYSDSERRFYFIFKLTWSARSNFRRRVMLGEEKFMWRSQIIDFFSSSFLVFPIPCEITWLIWVSRKRSCGILDPMATPSHTRCQYVQLLPPTNPGRYLIPWMFAVVLVGSQNAAPSDDSCRGSIGLRERSQQAYKTFSWTNKSEKAVYLILLRVCCSQIIKIYDLKS